MLGAEGLGSKGGAGKQPKGKSGKQTPKNRSAASEKTVQALQRARPFIEDLIADNPRLVPLFVRMGFHDCITVCDGMLEAFELTLFPVALKAC